MRLIQTTGRVAPREAWLLRHNHLAKLALRELLEHLALLLYELLVFIESDSVHCSSVGSVGVTNLTVIGLVQILRRGVPAGQLLMGSSLIILNEQVRASLTLVYLSLGVVKLLCDLRISLGYKVCVHFCLSGLV